jgi:hypothetical protein
LRSLLYQHWDPPPREERGLRWFAGTFSVLLHVGFALLLIVVALVRYLPPMTQQEVARTQVSFLGKGTPEEEGGGAPAQEAAAAASTADEETAASAAPARSSPARASTAPPQAAPTQQQAAQAAASEDSVEQTQAGATASAPAPVPAPVEPAPPTPQPPVEAPQNVQVSQADQQPQQEFVLPPMTPPQLPQVQTRTSEVTVPQREVTVVERPAIRAPAMPQTTPPQPTLRAREISVREREIPAPPEPLPEIRSSRPVAQREVQVRQPQASSATLAQREIQMPEIAPPAPPTPVPAAAPATSAPSPTQQQTSQAAASATAQTTPEDAKQASEPTAARPSSSASSRDGATATASTSAPTANRAQPAPPGATPAPTSGSWSSSQKADDWGVADRTTPGARASDGLFNADGSVKLAGEGDGGTQDKGPPGSRQAQAIDANKAGEWLDRPPAFTYEQSKFEKYWVPNESLLQEWVRRNIRELEIPIPGTSKRIKCVVSVLQLGGGCGVYDPNLQEQPAQSRPPPEIPVKRNPIPVGS